MKVYLAGGMKISWRKFFHSLNIDGLIFYDPTVTLLNDPAAYTLWDLKAIKNCDVVLGYFESTNPSGIGLACEIGYAVGLGKVVILVNEQPDNHYFDFVVNAGVTNVSNFDTAAHLLVTLTDFYKD